MIMPVAQHRYFDVPREFVYMRGEDNAGELVPLSRRRLAAFGYLRVLTRPRGGRLRSATTTYPPRLVSVNVRASSARTMRNCANLLRSSKMKHFQPQSARPITPCPV